jgi:2-iminobutanoate/2-iminopropanoate deaminase
MASSLDERRIHGDARRQDARSARACELIKGLSRDTSSIRSFEWIGPSTGNCRRCGEGNAMTRQIVFTTKAAKPPATYSQAVKAAGLVFVSGTAPADPETGTIKGETIQEQTAQCLVNIRAILAEAGSSLDKIVSATVVLADEDDFAGMNEEWLKWFPSNPPARQGAKLPARVPGLKVSIAAIAEA